MQYSNNFNNKNMTPNEGLSGRMTSDLFEKIKKSKKLPLIEIVKSMENYITKRHIHNSGEGIPLELPNKINAWHNLMSKSNKNIEVPTGASYLTIKKLTESAINDLYSYVKNCKDNIVIVTTEIDLVEIDAIDIKQVDIDESNSILVILLKEDK